MIHIRTLRAEDLKSIENIIEQSIGFGDEIFAGRNFVTNSRWTNDSTYKKSNITCNVLSFRFVDVNVAIICEDRLERKIGKARQLKLECQRRFDMTNRRVFEVCRTAERIISRIIIFLPTSSEGDTSDSAFIEFIDKLCNDFLNAS